MKKTIFILAALVGAMTWTACEKEQLVPEKEFQRPQKEETALTLTLKASKAQPGTKALDLSSDGKTLNVYWKTGEKVKVFKGDACIGTLNVTPGEGEKPTNATLSGNINMEGIIAGDNLTLLLPREVWDYTGQTGALTGDNSLESLFDYSLATVQVSAVTSTTITASNATFENQQSVYRFSFKTGGEPLVIKSFSVYAKGGNFSSVSNLLVKTRTFSGGTWTSTTAGQDELDVSLPSMTSDPVYMAIRNESNYGDDIYYFHVVGSDGTLYSGSKGGIPSAYYSPGHFISMKNISVSKYTVPENDDTAYEPY